MLRARIAIVVFGLLGVTSPSPAQSTKDSVVAVVNEFFAGMAARDTARLARVQSPEGVLYAARVRGDSATIGHDTFESFNKRFAAMKDTIVERMWEPTVLIRGPLAIVWAQYDLHRNRAFVHCGVDAFTLMRTPTGWKVTTVSYTAEPTGCAPSPLGPLPAR